MKPIVTAPSTRPVEKISTEVLAAKFGARPQTPRASYCRFGHWLGLIPTKIPNGRLMWDALDADRLLAGETVKTPDAADLEKHFERKAADASKVPPHIRAKTEAKAKALTTVGGA